MNTVLLNVKRSIPGTVFLWLFFLVGNKAYSQCSVTLGSNVSICSGNNVTLSTVVVSGNPNSFTWTSSPSSSIPSTRNITVSPTVTTTYTVHAGGHGCNAQASVVVTVNPIPAAPSISFTPNGACSGTPLHFTTPQNSGFTYGWDFGDGNTGTGSSITHSFNAYGNGSSTFTVTLTDTSAAGCVNSSTQTINVKQGPAAIITPGFGVDTVTFNGVMTLFKCATAAQQFSQFTFTNGSNLTSGLNYNITWGDTGAPFNSTNWTTVNHIYTRGIYPLTYTVSDPSTGCSASTTYNVFFGSNPAGGIASLGNTDICGPGTLQFVISNVANNTRGTIYTITFNDSTPPLVFSNAPPDTISHYFSKSSCGITSSNGVTTFNNSFAARLDVKNPCGLTSGAVLPIYVSVPPIADYVPPTTACTGVNNLYINTSIPGLATNSSGCDNTTPILWHMDPDTGWTISQGSFGTDNGFVGGYFDPSYWTPGSNAVGINFAKPGTYRMRLVAANICGPDTIIKTICVSSPPATAFTLSDTSVTGCAPFTINVTNGTPFAGSCSGVSYGWAVGQTSATCSPDSSANYVFLGSANADSSTNILFNNEGVYAVTLNASNVCGSFPATKTVTVKVRPQAGITVPANICIGNSIHPTAAVQSCGGNISSYTWTFGGGTPATSNSQNPGAVTLGSAGQYAMSLIATNECGADTAMKIVTVDTIPIAKAGPDQLMCSGGSVQIGSANQNGLSYTWTPTNGLSSNIVSNPTVTLTNVTTIPQNYTYYLTVANPANCTSVDTVVVTVYPAAVVYAGPGAGVCSGSSIQLTGTYSGAASSATWTSSNGGTFGNANAGSTTYTPSITSGSVTLTLTTNDPAGPCPAVNSSMVLSVVSPPTADAGPDVSVCSGSPVHIGTAGQFGYTYAWSPSSGLDTNNIAQPIVTITNNTSSIITKTYTLIVSATGCSDTDQVVVSVYPGPGVNAGPSTSVCVGGSVTLTGTLSGTATSATWSSPSGTFSQPDSLTTVFTPTITSGMAVVTLTSNSTGGPCAAAVSTANITINPLPVITNNNLSRSICSGTSSQAVTIGSNIFGTQFTWSATASNGITGFIANGTDSIIPAQIISNTGTATGAVTYTIIPKANGCSGTSATYTINVDPQPEVANIAPQTICNGASSAAVTLNANINGTTFTWLSTANNSTLSGYASSGTGDIPAQTISNNSGTVDSVVYSITPSFNGCSGSPSDFVIYVNPSPEVNIPTDQTICSGASTVAANLSSNIPGATFSWTASGTANLTGYTASGNGNIPAQTINNSGIAPGDVTYAITASANSCGGAAAFYTVTINPIPSIDATPNPDTICGGASTNFTLTSDVNNATFTWTVNAPANITGANNGSGSSIQQTLFNNGQNLETVTYIVTPIANSCAGNPDSVQVVVSPGITVQFSPNAQTICSGQSTHAINISSPTSGVTFSWVSQANGVTGVAPSGSNIIPVQTLVNSMGTAAVVDYQVTANFASCGSITATYQITVNNGPQLTLPADQTICSGAQTTPVNFTSSTPGTTFTWVVDSATGVTGYLQGDNTAVIPAQTLTDNSGSQGSVVYTVTPNANGCDGPSANYTVYVNSSLVINALAPQTVCSGSATQATTPSSNIQNATFNWQAYSSSNVTGFTQSGTGTIPSETVFNAGYATDSLIYSISAVSGGCSSNPINYVVMVNPVPQVNFPVPQSICSGTASSAVNFTSNVAGTTYNWIASAPSFISGYSASGTGNIPAQTITNTGNAPDSVIFTVTPQANSCTGSDRKYSIVVNPAPIITTDANNMTVCSGAVADISISSNLNGVTFNWSANQPSSVTGAYGGSGNEIQQRLSNSSSTPQIVQYIINSNGSTCAGLADTVDVLVSANVVIQFSPNPQTICSGQYSQPVTLSSQTQGVSFSWTAQANGITGVTTSGNDSIPANLMVNGTGAPATVTYAITGSSNGCSGQSSNYTVTVNPSPTVSIPLSQTVCSGASTNQVAFSSPVAGATFSWTGSSQNGVTGFIPSGNTYYIPSQVLNNADTVAGSVEYSITATSNGCSGMAASYVVSVNPLPGVVLPASQNICNDGTTKPVVLQAANTTFSWTSTTDPGVTGNTPNGVGDIPSQTLHSTSPMPAIATYIVTPNSNGCAGHGVSYVVTIQPTPSVSISPAPQVVCSGQNIAPVHLSSPAPGTTITWTAKVPSDITGAVANGTNLIPVQNLSNNSIDTFPRPLTINYTITATLNDTTCPSTNANYSITVMPKPVVDFVASVGSGCSPLSVDFVPQTMNYGIPDSVTFNWGDGTPNTVLHPSAVTPEWITANHIFYNNGSTQAVYKVTLTAHSACFDTTIIHPVTVSPTSINAFFNASVTSGCEPLAVTLTDQSVGASLISWCFDYNLQNDSCMGGGEVDTAGTVITHTFTAGTHTVALYINNGYGCGHDTAYQTITVAPAPSVDFTAPGSLCSQGASTFNSTTSTQPGSFITQYDWQFGDGQASSDANPTNVFDTAGTYNVCLRVTTSYGCTNSICHPITIGQKPVANFTTTDACLNAQTGQFVNHTIGDNYYEWMFGDSATSTTANPNHIYNAPGKYMVMLVVSNSNCNDTAVSSVTIHPVPHAGFITPSAFTCGLPSSIQLTNTSTGAISYQWDLGNGMHSQFENPVATYNTQGTDTIVLVATNQYNCADTALKPVSIYPLPSLNSVDVQPAQGCKPLYVMFKANATNANHYVWNFGDGTTYESDGPFASHTYTDSGTYSVQLQMYSYSACGDTILLKDTVTVHPVPTAGFEYFTNDDAIYENGTVQFSNTSQGATSYMWNFADGSLSTEVNPSHMFEEINHFDVMLIATNQYGCSDTAIQGVFAMKKSLYVPNACAPDFAGFGELVKVWKPAGIGLRTYRAQVFDKWGELLWESSALTDDLQPAEGWDGTYQGKPCQQGVYVWKIEASFVDGSIWKGTTYGKEKIKKTIGSITLVR